MRSFSLFALAAAVFAPFVAAAPAPAPVGVVAGAGLGAGVAAVVPRSPDLPVGSDVVETAEGLVPRGGQKGVQAILIDLKVGLSVHIGALNCLTPANATTEVITPIITEIVKVIGVAVVELKALVGLDISVILCAVDGTVQVTVGVIAALLAEILCLLFGALGFVLSIVADVKILIKILVAVAFGDCICEFLNAVLCLVDGLLAALIPLVLGLLGIILALGLNVVAKVLCIL